MRPRPPAFLSLLVLLLAVGCDGLEAAPKQLGEACTRDYQCVTGLCCGGACSVPPACSDAAVDAAQDAAADAPTGG